MILWEVTKLVKFYKTPVKSVAEKIVLLLGCHCPAQVQIGKDVVFAHNAVGTVIHAKTVIEDRALIFQGVTIGKADIFENWKESKVKGFRIGEGAALCAGCKVLCKEGELTVGRYAIVAANAVLTHSIGDYKVWRGIPAHFIGYNRHALDANGLTEADMKS